MIELLAMLITLAFILALFIWSVMAFNTPDERNLTPEVGPNPPLADTTPTAEVLPNVGVNSAPGDQVDISAITNFLTNSGLIHLAIALAVIGVGIGLVRAILETDFSSVWDWVVEKTKRVKENFASRRDKKDVGGPEEEVDAMYDTYTISNIIKQCQNIQSTGEEHALLLSSLKKLSDIAQAALKIEGTFNDHNQARQVFSVHIPQLQSAMNMYASVLTTGSEKAKPLAISTADVAILLTNTLDQYIEDAAQRYADAAEKELNVVRTMTK